MSATKNYHDFIQAAKQGDIDEVNRLLPHVNPKIRDCEALYQAAQYGHMDIVELLVPLSGVEAERRRAIRVASVRGHLQIVKLLFPLLKPESRKNAGLSTAVLGQHVDIVKFLISVSDTHYDWEASLVTAAKNGSNDIVKLLLPKSTQKQLNDALYWAVNGNNYKTIDLLYSHCDVDFVLQKFDNSVEISHGLEYLKKIKQAGQTKAFLMDHVESNKPSRPSKKM